MPYFCMSLACVTLRRTLALSGPEFSIRRTKEHSPFRVNLRIFWPLNHLPLHACAISPAKAGGRWRQGVGRAVSVCLSGATVFPAS